MIAIKFPFANDLVNLMYKRYFIWVNDDIKHHILYFNFEPLLSLTDDERLSNIEESWDVVARRALIGEETIVTKCKESGQVADFTIAEYEDKANQLYLQALDKLNTLKMHQLYVHFCTERLKMTSKFLNDEVTLQHDGFLFLNGANKSYKLCLNYLAIKSPNWSL